MTALLVGMLAIAGAQVAGVLIGCVLFRGRLRRLNG